MNLHQKIIGSTLFLLVSIGLLTALSMHSIVSRRLEDELIKRGESLARHVAARTFEFLLTENTIALKLYVTELLDQEEDLLYVLFLDGHGEVISHSFQGGFPSELRAANAVAEGEEVAAQLLRTEMGDVYDIAVPVGEGRLGVARVGFSRAVVRQGVRSVVDLGIALAIFFLIVGGGVAVILENTVLFPIARLTRTAERISRGNYSERAHVDGEDEVARMALAFNAMLEELEDVRKDLIRSNEELEEEIASRRKAEERIRFREKELRVIFESTPVMMALVGLDRKIRRVNRTWEEYVVGAESDSFGRSFGEALRCVYALESPEGCGTGETCEDCLLRAAVLGAIDRRVPVNQVEATLERRKGKRKEAAHLLVSATPVFIAEEDLVLVCIEDITPLKEAELRLQEALGDLEKQNRELKELDVMKDSLIRDVSHELKTPVAKYSMQLEILRDSLRSPGEAAEKVLHAMEENVMRQKRVIGNILDLNRLEGGERRYQKAGMRLDQLLLRVVDEYEHLLRAYGLEMRTYIEQTTIVSDEGMLWHVFSNLLGNAVKFTRQNPHGMITVSTAQENGWVTVRIDDNGLGVSEEGTEKAFSAFYQDSASIEGIGVGLSITKTIVEGLGGKVRLESEGRGKGASAIVQLPVGDAVGEIRKQ